MLLKNSMYALVLLFTALSLSSCKSGYNRTYQISSADEDAPGCDNSPLNSNANANTVALFDLIVDLTCDRIEDYVLVGQSTGNGDEIVDENNDFRNYETLIESPTTDYDKRISIVSIDYENSARFDAATLTRANEQLQEHFLEGGIVSITWTPLNPWTAEDGTITNKLAVSDDTDLSLLYGTDTTDASYLSFNSQLDLIAEQLKELSDANIPVLFAPFPEINTDNYWYGANTNNTSNEVIELWTYVFDRLNQENLTNILWVYAPRSGVTSERLTSTWGYPGTAYVDIVAAISYSDEVSVLDYADLINLDKPMGMTRLAPKSTDGTFDNQNYAVELQGRYPYIAYWIADHDTETNSIRRSIVRNNNAEDLLNNDFTATVETIIDEDWLDTN
jgi:beta-mannanase